MNEHIGRAIHPLNRDSFMRFRGKIIDRLFFAERGELWDEFQHLYNALFSNSESYIKDHYGRDEHYWSNSTDSPARRVWEGLVFEQVPFVILSASPGSCIRASFRYRGSYRSPSGNRPEILSASRCRLFRTGSCILPLSDIRSERVRFVRSRPGH